MLCCFFHSFFRYEEGLIFFRRICLFLCHYRLVESMRFYAVYSFDVLLLICKALINCSTSHLPVSCLPFFYKGRALLFSILLFEWSELDRVELSRPFMVSFCSDRLFYREIDGASLSLDFPGLELYVCGLIDRHGDHLDWILNRTLGSCRFLRFYANREAVFVCLLSYIGSKGAWVYSLERFLMKRFVYEDVTKGPFISFALDRLVHLYLLESHTELTGLEYLSVLSCVGYVPPSFSDNHLRLISDLFLDVSFYDDLMLFSQRHSVLFGDLLFLKPVLTSLRSAVQSDVLLPHSDFGVWLISLLRSFSVDRLYRFSSFYCLDFLPYIETPADTEALQLFFPDLLLLNRGSDNFHRVYASLISLFNRRYRVFSAHDFLLYAALDQLMLPTALLSSHIDVDTLFMSLLNTNSEDVLSFSYCLDMFKGSLLYRQRFLFLIPIYWTCWHHLGVKAFISNWDKGYSLFDRFSLLMTSDVTCLYSFFDILVNLFKEASFLLDCDSDCFIEDGILVALFLFCRLPVSNVSVFSHVFVERICIFCLFEERYSPVSLFFIPGIPDDTKIQLLLSLIEGDFRFVSLLSDSVKCDWFLLAWEQIVSVFSLSFYRLSPLDCWLRSYEGDLLETMLSCFPESQQDYVASVFRYTSSRRLF